MTTQHEALTAQIRDMVAAAIKPYEERLERRQADREVRDAITSAAKDTFHDPTDALIYVDPTTVLDTAGQVDPAKVADAFAKVIEKKPYLGMVRRPVTPARPVDDRAAYQSAMRMYNDDSKFLVKPKPEDFRTAPEAPLDPVAERLAAMHAAVGTKQADTGGSMGPTGQ